MPSLTRLSFRITVAAGLGFALVIAGVADAALCATPQPPVVNSALGCVETVVTRSIAPTGPSMAAGGDITFRDDIAPGHGAGNQKIVSVYVPPDESPNTNAGDHVRVCLLTMPKKTGTGPGTCNPAVDIRGRQFLIFDRANDRAAVFSNGEHDCGGA